MKKILLFRTFTCRITFLFILGSGCLQQKAVAADGHWVGTWACGPQKVENTPSQNNLPPATLAYSTLRQFVHTTIGGQHLRVRFSNAYGTNAVVIQSAHIALAAGTGSAANGVINPATDTTLKFHGGTSITIPPGEVVWSDPCDFDLPALTNLAVSIYYGYVSPNVVYVGTITGHPGSRTTSYIQAGNVVSASSMPAAVTTQHWYTITGVDVLGDSSSHALTIIGDSITDGRGSDTDGNDRWPDDLATRLATNPPTASVGVLNMGIGGGGIFGGLGPAGLNRFDRDTWEQSGARWLIVFIGVNDIGGNGSSTTAQAMSFATNMIAAYTSWADTAHAHNMLAYGATITPFDGNSYYSTIHEYERQYVNNWFRTNNVFDGVIDLDAALRSSTNSAYLNADYEFEWLHLNPAGTQAAANAIDLSLFTH